MSSPLDPCYDYYIKNQNKATNHKYLKHFFGPSSFLTHISYQHANDPKEGKLPVNVPFIGNFDTKEGKLPTNLYPLQWNF